MFVRFGMFYELQLPRPWAVDSEQRLVDEAIEQCVLGDEIGLDYAWSVEHHFLEEYSHCSASEVFLSAIAAKTENINVGFGIRQIISNYNHPARTAEWLASYKAHLDGESGRRSFWIWTYDKDPGHGLSQVRRSALRQQGIYPAPLGPDTTHLAQPLDCLGPFREMKRNWRKAVAEKDPSAPHFTLGRNWDVVTWQLLRFGTAEVFAKAGYSVGPRDASLFWGKLRDLMESEAAAPGAEAGDAMPLGGTS